jgi:hypothetical protein
MRIIALLLLILALPCAAKPTRARVKAEPLASAPADPIRPAMAPQRTVQEDAELRDWITGMMTENSEAKAENTALKTENSALKDQLTAAQDFGTKAKAASDAEQGQIADLNMAIDGLKKYAQQQEERAEKAEATVAKQAKDIARFGKLCRVLAFILAGCAALFAFRETRPSGLLSALVPATALASVAVPVIVFSVVFGASEAYLRFFF